MDKLRAGLVRLLDTGELSDLVISCQGQKHNVHKAVICSQSEVFMRMMTSGFKESSTNIIDLPEDDPHIVNIMVHYLYHLDYDLSSMGLLKRPESPVDGSTPSAQSESDEYHPIVFHVKVYLIARKYMLHGLKDEALKQFMCCLDYDWESKAFQQAVVETYEWTDESDQTLRDTILESLHIHNDILDDGNLIPELENARRVFLDYVRFMKKNY